MQYIFIRRINNPTFLFCNFAESAFVIMWRKADEDKNKYLVVDDNVMDVNEGHRISVELNHDKDAEQNGKQKGTLTFFTLFNFALHNA